MKILHVADTHLGYSAYRKLAEEGINQREKDVYDAFQQFVDYAVDVQPDLVIHGGDLFDSVRPTNRAITFAVQQIMRLSRRSIPLVIIAGNHEQPKLKETGSIFSIFDHMDNVYPVYQDGYQSLTFDIGDENVCIHSIPHCQSKDRFTEDLKKAGVDESADYNILVTHGTVKGVAEYSMHEFNELIVPMSALKKEFDYVALGHYHTYTEVLENAVYPGSTERFAFADAGEDKGFVKLELRQGNVNHTFVSLDVRPMFDVGPIDCSDLSVDEVMQKVKEAITSFSTDGALFRIVLQDIPSPVYRGIDFGVIRELSKDAVHHEVKADVTKEGNDITHRSSSGVDALTTEFKRFLSSQDLKDKDTLLQLGLDYIQKLEAAEEES